MAKTRAEHDGSPTVSERLVAGGVQLIDSDGDANLSVRRLAEASGRSTMCVYTYFGGREALLAAVHDRAATEVRDALASTDAPRAALATWLAEHPRLALWLFTATIPADLDARRTDLMAAVRALLGGDSAAAQRTVATMIGYIAVGEPVPLDA